MQNKTIAFAIFSVLKWLNSQLPSHPRLRAFFRSISPRHFSNGDWNTGGSCDNEVPLSHGSEGKCIILSARIVKLLTNYFLFPLLHKILQLNSPKRLDLKIDLYDEVGIGGGASGIAGGLLHPYSPKVKLLWEGAQCWNDSINLLKIAEEVANSRKCKVGESSENIETFVGHKRQKI
ncbi:hypothetical protein K1719_041875 [Acacia pycnantha]|nr:hypothetical protein K1719_041875 [Acacia pycnantha]